MNKIDNRFLFLLLGLSLLCSSVQATTLLIHAQDSIDNTSISQATVFLNGANLGRTDSFGNFSLQHSGLYDVAILLQKTGYDDWALTVNKSTTYVIANMSRKTLKMTVNLYDSDSLAAVTGATIAVTADNNTQTKLSDSAGAAVFAVNGATLYSLSITSPNYQPRTDTVETLEKDVAVQYWLLSGNRYSFVVKDKDTQAAIPDAEIRLDTVLLGKTDSRGILSSPIMRGKTYTIVITKDGYDTVTETRTISETDALYAASLTKTPVGAFVFVTDDKQSPLSGAAVSINGSVVGTTNQYGRADLSDLLAGSYQVQAQKQGYVATTQQFNVSKDSKEITIQLPVATADLTIYVQDKDQKNLPNATISVNGKALGVSDDHGQYVTSVNYNTEYNISAGKDGYSSVAVVKQVSLNETSPAVTITLEKNADYGFVTMIVLGIIALLVIFAVIRFISRRKRRHVIRRNEI